MTAPNRPEWFAVDRQGLGAILERRGREFAVFELVQNALDEDVRRVSVRLEPVPRKEHLALLVVEDDDPDGFTDLTHAFTLFASSEKKADPTKRGRFNLGEKLVLALCESASIATTTGLVRFMADGSRRTDPGARTERGSIFEGRIRLNTEEQQEVGRRLLGLLPPPGVTVTFNGAIIPERRPVLSFECSLPTEVADSEGRLKRLRRRTTVSLYEPENGEEPSLYELGIPVVPTLDRWHYDVAQKVPVSMERDNVTPAYLREIRTYVLNHTADLIDADMANATWGRDAASDERAEPEAIRAVVAARFGDKVVSYDPSDQEANKMAVAAGYVVVHGSQLSKPEWENVRGAGAILPAGRVTPSPKPYADGRTEDGRDLTFLHEDEYTPAQRVIVAYARAVGRGILNGFEVDVRIVREPHANFLATYGRSGRLVLNLGQLGSAWFDSGLREEVDSLLIHEFGHHYSTDHLSESYYHALCDLGARLKTWALTAQDAMKKAGIA